MAKVELIIRYNGSTKVVGDVVLRDENGKIIEPPERPFKLCRCGASQNKPFCDGTHRLISWTDGSGQERTT